MPYRVVVESMLLPITTDLNNLPILNQEQVHIQFVTPLIHFLC